MLLTQVDMTQLCRVLVKTCCTSCAHDAGLSEAMLRGGAWQLGEKGTHYIKTIKNSSHHLANIINDILDAAAFSKGRLVIKREKARPLYYTTICHSHTL